MIEYKDYTNFRDFIIFNEKIINGNSYFYYHLENTIERARTGKVQVHKFFNIIDENKFISVLLIKDECLIYANEISDQMIKLLSRKIEIERFNQYSFFGTKQVIDALFALNNITYSELKYRKYYECSQVVSNFQNTNGNISMGSLEYLSELIKFGTDFKKEFCEEDNDVEDVQAIILSGIINKNIYQWELDSQICGMAQVQYDEFDFPVIGYVYTSPKYREKGVASSLVFEVTKGVLNAGFEKCMLMTDAYNPSSNKAFEKIGYTVFGEYVVRFKEK